MPERIQTLKAVAPSGSRHEAYERAGRDRERAAFYYSRAWRRCRAAYLASRALCERCLARGDTVLATIVHHKVEVAKDWGRRFDLENLEALCSSCHSSHHASSGSTTHKQLTHVMGGAVGSEPRTDGGEGPRKGFLTAAAGGQTRVFVQNWVAVKAFAGVGWVRRG
jgi:hypothetical protein